MNNNHSQPDTVPPMGESQKFCSSSSRSSSYSDLFFDFESEVEEEKNDKNDENEFSFVVPDSKEEWQMCSYTDDNDDDKLLQDANYETAVEEEEEEEDSEEEQRKTVRIAKHKIATSKLKDLRNSLEKERILYKRDNEIDYSNTSSSPVDFSYLSSSATASTAAIKATVVKFSHSISMPALTSWEREYMESPKLQQQQRRPKMLDFGEYIATFTKEICTQDEPTAPEPKIYKRCSSLKSGKTPPEMASRRKIVRFSDVLGLDLADVKLFFAGELPNVPKCAYADLQDTDHHSSDSDSSDTLPKLATMAAATTTGTTTTSCIVTEADMLLVPMFSQPGGFSNFFDLLESKKVCLEEARMSGPQSITGTVRVWNIGFEKEVTVRYTTNEWIKCTDLEAEYQDDSCDGCSDKFVFSLRIPEDDVVLVAGQRLQLCIKYRAGSGVEFWDNNDGKNYVFQCVRSCSEAFLGASPEESWQ